MSSSSLSVTTPAHGPGIVDVRITENLVTSAASSVNLFTFAARPTVSSLAVGGVSPATGPKMGGTTVVITGAGFFVGATVSFGGTAATSFTVDSDIQITAVSPAATAAGAVDVTVTTSVGTSLTSGGDQFTYLPTSVATAIAQGAGVVAIDSAPVVTAILSHPSIAGDPKSYTSWSFLIQDATGSMDVYASATALTGLGYTPTVGDAINLSATVSPYHQIPELGTVTAITKMSSGNTVAPPVATTITHANQATLASDVAGYLVKLSGVTISGISGNFLLANLQGTISDGTNSMTFYYWPTSYNYNTTLYNTPIPTTSVDVVGFMSVYPGPPANPEFTPVSVVPHVVSLPAWLSSGSVATWSSSDHKLDVTGAATIIADPGADMPVITVESSGTLHVAPTGVGPAGPDTLIHFGGLTDNGSVIADSVAGRSATNHLVIEIGAATGAAPVFAIGTGAKFDLKDNDLIAHKTDYSTVFNATTPGRGTGIWDGTTGLMSSTAGALNAGDGGGSEYAALAVQLNDWSFNANPDAASFTTGGHTIALNPDTDVIVKYTYVGDYNLDGKVNGLDASILGVGYDDTHSYVLSWGYGDTNRDGWVDGLDASAFGSQYFGNGTADSYFSQQL